MLLRNCLIASSLSLFISPAFAQFVSVGAKVGVPLTTTYNQEFVPDGGVSTYEYRATVGPAVELYLPHRLSVEIDALWRRSSFTSISAHSNLNFSTPVNDWQFPFLLRYSIKAGGIHPFLNGGGVYRYVSTVAASVLPPNHPRTAGVTAGGGVSLKLPHLHLSPEIRYTWWPTQAFASGYYGPVASRSSQVDLLIGVTFFGRRDR